MTSKNDNYEVEFFDTIANNLREFKKTVKVTTEVAVEDLQSVETISDFRRAFGVMLAFLANLHEDIERMEVVEVLGYLMAGKEMPEPSKEEILERSIKINQGLIDRGIDTFTEQEVRQKAYEMWHEGDSAEA